MLLKTPLPNNKNLRLAMATLGLNMSIFVQVHSLKERATSVMESISQLILLENDPSALKRGLNSLIVLSTLIPLTQMKQVIQHVQRFDLPETQVLEQLV